MGEGGWAGGSRCGLVVERAESDQRSASPSVMFAHLPIHLSCRHCFMGRQTLVRLVTPNYQYTVPVRQSADHGLVRTLSWRRYHQWQRVAGWLCSLRAPVFASPARTQSLYSVSRARTLFFRQPYQNPTFVTPPFAGYVSGHSTFSFAAATALREFFDGGWFFGALFVSLFFSDLFFFRSPSLRAPLAFCSVRR